MKTIAELVLEYFDSIPVGELAIRKDLIKYVDDNIHLTDAPTRQGEYNRYTTVDVYKRILQLNNIISEPPGNKLGVYIKLNPIPTGVSMNELKNRVRTNNWDDMNPYYKNKTVGIFGSDLLKELCN